MSRLVWDGPGEKQYEAGLDRGVLYPTNTRGWAWNGLVRVSESEEGGENTPLYQDGVKLYNKVIPGDYQASIEAYTYPDQLESAMGISTGGNGLLITNQYPRRFSMSYRTGIGNDQKALGTHYKIHIIYNATIVTGDTAKGTVEAQVSPELFQWDITTEPPVVEGIRPTSHFIIDSRHTDPRLLMTLEGVLWGGAGRNASLIYPNDLINLYSTWHPTGYGHGLYGRTNGYGHGNEYDFLG